MAKRIPLAAACLSGCPPAGDFARPLAATKREGEATKREGEAPAEPFLSNINTAAFSSAGASLSPNLCSKNKFSRVCHTEQETCEPANRVVGTPQYMPPEQADGISDARSDVFGLGAILYEMLTDSSPHAWPEGSRPADWLRIVRDAQFPPPRRLKPRLPRALEAICLKALARNPGARYRGAAELAHDVRRHLAGLPLAVQAEPAQVTGWQRLTRGRQFKGET